MLLTESEVNILLQNPFFTYFTSYQI